ncbi:MAG: DNA polymerase I [Lachnospiraceae bacterium]
MNGKIVLIDGHSILNRAFYGLPDLTNAEGLHTNAVYGFINILLKTIEEEQPEYLAVAFDLHAPTFRHKMFEAYKGTRKPMPQELRQQVPIMQDVLRAMGVTLIMKEGYEADDLLGTIAKQSEAEGLEVTVLSGDRDLLQLVTDHIKVRIPKTRMGKTTIEDYYVQDVVDKYQLKPLQIIELKALMGDASDNIPGLPGVGEKTATKILLEYETIENAYAHVEEIKPNKAKNAFLEHYDMAVLSKKLATIELQVPISFDWEQSRLGDLFTQEAYEWFKELEFKNLLSRFSDISVSGSKLEEAFETVTDFGKAEEIFALLAKKETVGIQLLTEKHRVLGLGAAWMEEETPKAVFCPVEGFLTENYLCDQLSAVCNRVKSAASLNVKAMLPYITVEKQETFFDNGLAAYLLNPLKSSYSYDDIAKEYLDQMLPAKEDLLGKLSYEKGLEEKFEQVAVSACYMAYTALASKSVLTQKLEETGMWQLFQEIEMPLVFTLYDMEKEGIRVQAEELKEYGSRLNVRILELEEEIYAQAGEKFNINSPKQLGVILFEKMQMPGGKKTKTGYSTAADVLEKLAPDHKIVADILEYRQLAKLKSTYADGLANYIAEDGRIHSNFNQTITATGRISSTEPNLQNIPIRMELGRLIRKVFVPKDGYVFLDGDYSQIELRVLAHMSGDEMLIQAYKEAQDIHRMTASQVFHVPFDEVTDLQRRNAKAVNFGIVYGISSFGLSQDLSITRKEAAEYIARYFETYPKIKGFLDGLVEQGKEKGYVTTMFGRRRPIPELSSSNFMQRSFGERVAMNSPIQGTAADIIKIAMIRVNQALKEQGLKSRLILQVHDELLIETAKDEVETVSAILEKEMKGAADLAVSLEVDMHTGENWYEAK